jgi:hypothetical protein
VEAQVKPGTPVLTISQIDGGAFADKTWTTSVNALCHQLLEIARGYESPMNLDVLFIVPGEVFQPDFAGLLQQRFRSHQNLLRIEVALTDPPSDDPHGDLHALMGRAIDMAEAYARRKRIADDLRQIRELHARLIQQP